MSATNDGGPAYPVASDIYHGSGITGMSLRDWFAGQALAGFLACSEVSGSADTLARDAYGMADAMLRAREGGAK